MALTQEYLAAVEQKNSLRVKIMLKDSLLVDTSFKQFNEMISYAERKKLDIWIDDERDDEEFTNVPDGLDAILVGLVNNFSHRRVRHLKRMISQMYPSQPKQSTKDKNAAEYKQKTKSDCESIKEIKNRSENISQLLRLINRDKQKVSLGQIEKLRKDAKNIIKLCDKISGK